MGFDVGDGGGKKGSSSPDMNVTPLVDVVLVLLIIFMVITPLLSKQFWVVIPPEPDEDEQEEPDPPDEDRPPPIVVTVDGEGQARINRDAVDDEDLPARVRGALGARQAAGLELQVIFDAANDAAYGRVVEVLDRVRGADPENPFAIVVSTRALPIPTRN